MKKIFLFAAAVVAALSVNAKVVTFSGIVDKTSAETAKSTFEAAFSLDNLSVEGKANSDASAYYAELTQVTGTEDWLTTKATLKSDAQVYLAFKDKSNNKVVMKYWADYAQPNGKAVCLVITGLQPGNKVTINLKEALKKETQIEGADIEKSNFENASIELIALASEIRVYSRNVAGDADAKWKLQSVEVPDGNQAIDNIEAGEKTVKFFENGQLIILKNGVRYNALGAKL